MAIVMGTAGHIDHGKTSLVRKLTGIDCDRLEEEKRRGITIELGFAFCDLPGGGRLGIVDVPGHEKFVKNMVAGASGIDFVMLVVAADEGVMPQTREHLEICSLLGIKHGLVAVTKIDMVDPELLELAVEDISEFLKGTFLEGAPLFPVSSQTGEGVDKLRDYIVKQEKELAPRRRTDLFRLPVDRVFTLKGHGTIVTGTMISGSVKVGDALELLPKKLATRARSLQSHGESVEVAESGHRTAVNLQGLDVADVERGDVLALPGTLFPSDRWLVRLTCLGSSPRALRHRAEIHFHHEAREIAARLYFLDRDKLGPGETALCEVRLDEPLVGVFGDHCVVRAFSPLRTVAGGVVLDPISAGLRRRDATPDRVASLLGLEDASDEDRVRMQIELAGNRGANLAQLSVLTNLDSKRLDKVLQALSGKGKIFCFDREEKVTSPPALPPNLPSVALPWPMPSIKRNRSSRAWRAARSSPAARAARRGARVSRRSWLSSSWSACCVRASWFPRATSSAWPHTPSPSSPIRPGCATRCSRRMWTAHSRRRTSRMSLRSSASTPKPRLRCSSCSARTAAS